MFLGLNVFRHCDAWVRVGDKLSEMTVYREKSTKSRYDIRGKLAQKAYLEPVALQTAKSPNRNVSLLEFQKIYIENSVRRLFLVSDIGGGGGGGSLVLS